MKRFKNILVYAEADQHETAVRRAVTVASENNADVTLMEVIKPIPHAVGYVTHAAEPEELQRLIVEDHRKRLLEIATEYLNTGVPIDVFVTVGDSACEMVRQVVNDKHDLVIKAADGLSLSGRWFGSISRSLLRMCPCPVWILKPEVHGDFDQVVAAIDIDTGEPKHLALNRKILELAFAIAERDNADLHVVSAWDLWMEKSLRKRAGDAEVDSTLSGYEKRLRTVLNELVSKQEAKPKSVQIHFIRGNPSKIIEAVSQKVEADLVVMGTVCRTGAASFLIGNTAESLLEHVTCSVLALKPEGFVSPITFDDSDANTSKETLPIV
ncbi:Universal stress protein E [Planctomycetes bacterium CA13]|uniref:Universal stress protein E n=1 Tax=Novipirellula herctigrandis TaxID=2527986 RepID=A0A5C5Z7D5_9BACT|nr:Universal stress protein E [Planctomycetes bacterium CA13]